MAQVSVHIPSILATLIGVREVAVNADSVKEALAQLTSRHPPLEQALFDEAGVLRAHVLCFHNAENTRWHAEGLDRAVLTGDRITILQAVAGG